MKIAKVLFVLSLFLTMSCSNKDETVETVDYTVGKPIKVSITEIRNSIAVEDPQPTTESGKMYQYEDYVFVNEKNEGVHVIKGLEVEHLQKIKFLRIPGNKGISVRDGFLYADSYFDLVVFDISDIDNIQHVSTLENVFPNYFYNYIDGADWFDFAGVDFENEIIIGWELVIETYPAVNYDDFEIGINNAGGNGSATGTGGSLARFKMVGDYLYVVDSSSLLVFEISNLTEPIFEGTEYVGSEIETIFHDNGFLYIGSSSGMFIYSLVVPQQPLYVSTISHIMGCDPVVVKDDYAYVTIRGGNFCGQDISELDVIDISDKSSPFIATSVKMIEPYGLGAHNESLYVSDGEAGIKLFNIENPTDIFLENEFEDVHILDIIPLEEKLLMVGDNTLYIYHYLDGNLELSYTFNLD
jgi:hypothetical protein